MFDTKENGIIDTDTDERPSLTRLFFMDETAL